MFFSAYCLVMSTNFERRGLQSRMKEALEDLWRSAGASCLFSLPPTQGAPSLLSRHWPEGCKTSSSPLLPCQTMTSPTNRRGRTQSIHSPVSDIGTQRFGPLTVTCHCHMSPSQIFVHAHTPSIAKFCQKCQTNLSQLCYFLIVDQIDGVSGIVFKALQSIRGWVVEENIHNADSAKAEYCSTFLCLLVCLSFSQQVWHLTFSPL